MKLFALEEGKTVNPRQLLAELMLREDYISAHQGLPIPCHDIVIEYQSGALLVVRNDYPAKGLLWSIGGRILRGMDIAESLKIKVKEECNLELEEITELGYNRTFFSTDPFQHGKGTDTINFMFYGKGKGELKLNQFHATPTIIEPYRYTAEFRKMLHPFVQEIMDRAMKFIR